MIAGVRGRLVSASFASEVLPEIAGVGEAPSDFVRALARWNAARESQLGPASSVRAIADAAAVPLLHLLGYAIAGRIETADRSELRLTSRDAAIPAIVVPWSASLDGAWRTAVLRGIAADVRWCFCVNGRVLRLLETQRTWSRQHLEFDLSALTHIPDAVRLLWTLAHADAITGRDALLERAVALSARHGAGVCRALGDGVVEALRTMVRALADADRRRPPMPRVLEQSLTVLYRVLFLLFSEARGLVPVWHPVYRDRYTIDGMLTSLAEGRPCRGAWQALQAISRLAHSGCRAGDLHVTAFNGRLFSPVHAPSAERGQIDDPAVGAALLAVGTIAGPSGRTRIRYRDLDVEQLGAVYEHLLDYEATRERGVVLLRRTGDLRKATGTFYTPRAVTSYLVRRTLAPLVRNRTAAEILQLRVVDPAMGSGAFLVAACRYLASAVEAARLRDGEWHPDEATREARAMLRREVAQRCLFGVDLNPMAVQLARLSLWLATLASDRPLSFLDHHLVAGDSLTGAMLAEVASRPPGRASRSRATLPLFEPESLTATVRDVVSTRLRLMLEADDDVQSVRRKEGVLLSLKRDGSAWMRWKRVLDLWCACWFWPGDRRPSAAAFHAISDAWLGKDSTLPEHVVREWQAHADAAAARHAFVHWEVEFPEVFFDDRGDRLATAGFDAVIGNPPWDMIRGDSGDAATRSERRNEARQLLDFVRGSGAYACDARSHVNRYQLFAERALHLIRPGGRIGLALPSGAIADAGSAPLRRLLFHRANVDFIVGLDNREAIFPIHRSVRFVLATATAGAPTDRIDCRFGVSDPARLDAVDDDARGAPAFPVSISKSLLARLSGEDDLAIPELASPMDLRIAEKISSAHPWLSDADGWSVRFGRELNASDDRAAFVAPTGARGARPVLEGKQIAPFRVALGACTRELDPRSALSKKVPRRPRLAYRDVASATNRLTLIAAIVPPRAVTTHTLFCLRTPLALERQQVLCALLNSFVANYLVRQRVNTHVTIAITSRLAVPVVPHGGPLESRVAELVSAVATSDRSVEEMAEYVELQALAAWLYRLTNDEFEHVLGTFPLIPIEVRRASLERLTAMQ